MGILLRDRPGTMELKKGSNRMFVVDLQKGFKRDTVEHVRMGQAYRYFPVTLHPHDWRLKTGYGCKAPRQRTFPLHH